MALKREITAKIKELLGQNPKGLSITQIVNKIAINRNTAGRYLENLTVSGQVEMRQFGMAKIYRLAQRVPLSAMLSISSDLIMLLDNSLRIIYANEPMYRFLGTTQKELYGKNIEFSPCVTVFDDAFEALRKHVKAGVTGREWRGELSLANRDMIVSCRIAPAVFEEGQRGVSVLLEDVTDRKRAEHTIQESERQFRLLAENSLDMIHRHTPDDVCIYISPASKTILGYSPDELIGHPVFEVLHPDDAQILPEYKSRLNQKNHAAKISYRVRHRDGHYVWLESVLRAIFDEKTGEFLEIYGVTRDISKRKKAEDALRESEDRYRKLVEISPDAVILHRDEKIIYMNPAACELLGFPQPGVVIGKNILDFIQPDFRDTVRKNIENDLRGDRTLPVELQMIRADGTLITVEGRGVRTFIGGDPAVQVAIRDITERKRAEEALQSVNERLRYLLASTSVAIYTSRTSGDYGAMSITDNVVQMTGYEPSDFIENSSFWIDHVHPEDKNRIQDDLPKIFDSGFHSSEYRFQCKDGEYIWIIDEMRLSKDENGRPLEIIGQWMNITERKLADEALRESEENYRNLIERANDGICVIQDGVVKFCNRRIAEFWGGSIHETLGRNFTDFVHPDVLPEIIDRNKRRMAGETVPSIYTTRLMRKDGSVFYAEVNAGLVTYSGKPGNLIIIRDINDRKKTKE